MFLLLNLLRSVKANTFVDEPLGAEEPNPAAIEPPCPFNQIRTLVPCKLFISP